MTNSGRGWSERLGVPRCIGRGSWIHKDPFFMFSLRVQKSPLSTISL